MATRPASLQHVVGDAFDPKALGAMFRDLRERIGLTQGQLGVKMGAALYQNISRLEIGRGKREPTIMFLRRFARACGWELVILLRPRRDDAEDDQDEPEGASAASAPKLKPAPVPSRPASLPKPPPKKEVARRR